MQISRSKDFNKQFQKLPPKIMQRFSERLQLFQHDTNHPQLHVHKLSGKHAGSWSLNVTGNIRAIFDKYEPDIVLFMDIGTHSELYE